MEGFDQDNSGITEETDLCQNKTEIGRQTDYRCMALSIRGSDLIVAFRLRVRFSGGNYDRFPCLISSR
jgi:hypothetical protein